MVTSVSNMIPNGLILDYFENPVTKTYNSNNFQIELLDGISIASY